MSEETQNQLFIDKLKSKLLDLSKRNNLVNYSFRFNKNRPSLRIVDEIPDVIYKKVQGNTPLGFKGFDAPEKQIYKDEQNKAFKTQLALLLEQNEEYQALDKNTETPNLKMLARLEDSVRDQARALLGLPAIQRTASKSLIDIARDNKIEPSFDLMFETSSRNKHSDNFIQTLLLKEDLSSTLYHIHSKAKNFEAEMGVNTLFLCFGFIEWYESSDSDKAVLSPVLILPVQIIQNKTGEGLEYKIQSLEEDAFPNMSIAEKFKQDFGLYLPEFDPEENELNPIKSYMEKVKTVINGQTSWRLLNQMTLGILSFQKIPLYNDLETLKDHVSETFFSKFSGVKEDLVSFEDDYNLEEKNLAQKIPPLVTNADSSQVSAILDAADGKNMVIEGPPGTGKSQTITNMIATLLSQNKKVLFVAEKMAALSVVKNRLDKDGLGKYCLELHSNKSKKSEVLASIKDGLDRSVRNVSLEYDALAKREAAIRDEIKSYLEVINQKIPNTESSVREQISLFLSILNNDSRIYRTMRCLKSLSVLNPEIINDLEKLKTLSGALSYENFSSHPLKSLAENLPSSAEKTLISSGPTFLLQQAEAIQPLSFISEFESQSLVAIEENALKIRKLPEAPKKLRSEIGFFSEAYHFENLNSFHKSMFEARELFLPSKSCIPLLSDEDFDKGMLYERLDTVISVLKELDFNGELYKLFEKEELLQKTFSSLSKNAESLKQIHSKTFSINGDIHADEFSDLFDFINITGNLPSECYSSLNEKFLSDNECKGAKELYQKRAKLLVLLNELKLKFRDGIFLSDSQIEDLVQFKNNSGFFTRFTLSYSKIKKNLSVIYLGKLNFTSLLELISKLEKYLSVKKAMNIVNQDLDLALSKIVQENAIATAVEAISKLNSQRALVAKRSFLKMTPEFLELIALMVSELPSLQDALPHVETSLKISLAQLSQELSHIKSLRGLCEGQIHLKSTLLDFQKTSASLPILSSALKSLKASPYSEILEIRSLDNLDLNPIERLINFVASVKASGFDDNLLKQIFSLNFVLGDFEKLKMASEQSLEKLGKLSSHEALRCGGVLSRDKMKSDNEASFNEFSLYIDDIKLLRGISEISSRISHLIDIEALIYEMSAGDIEVTAMFKAWNINNSIESLCGKIAFDHGTKLNLLREEYMTLDDKRLKLNTDFIHGILAKSPLPIMRKRSPIVKDKAGMDLIQHMIAKPGSRVALRELMLRASEEIQAIKPCFMMSPLSVAQFLPAENIIFDVLIVDEASQIRIEDILSSVVRAKQIVVVGDNKQMPPSNFFNSDDSEDDDFDSESLLDLAEKTLPNKRRLKWHYRSKHQDLIKFSNSYFYDNDLILFPSAFQTSPNRGLVPVKVDGIYAAGLNRDEAQRVVEEAVLFMKNSPDKSLGIVAINKQQANYIEDLLFEVIKDDPLVQNYLQAWDIKLESFFIKNLENVQGDERDAIFISMVYGRDSAGNFYNRFGPINSAKGHRRLNVLFSRAKELMKVFYSMPEEEILVDETSGREGVKCLKNFIRLLNTGKLMTDNKPKTKIDKMALISPFEEFVTKRLEDEGFLVEPQVGVSGYYIDLGIKDRVTGAYLLGIECDGRTYHSSKYIRDRDKIRQKQLEALGWTIHRIWSTDWFKTPDKEIEKIIARLKTI